MWDTGAFGDHVDPRATDVYAFSCLAYELLTGSTLFAGDSLPEIFAAHLGHDGDPAALLWLRQNPRHAPLAELLSAGLARDTSPATPVGASASRTCAAA